MFLKGLLDESVSGQMVSFLLIVLIIQPENWFLLNYFQFSPQEIKDYEKSTIDVGEN